MNSVSLVLTISPTTTSSSGQLKPFTEIGTMASLQLLKRLKGNDFSALVELGNNSELTLLNFGFKKLLVPASTELLTAFFSKDQKTLIKTPKAQKYTRKAIGAGLVSTDQEAWIAKRRQVNSIFSLQQINELMGIVQECIRVKLEEANDRITLNELFNTISMHVVGHTFFGSFSNEDAKEVAEAVSQMIAPTFKKIISPFPFFVDPFSKLISKSRKTLFAMLEKNIEKARAAEQSNLITQYYPTGKCTEDVSNLFVAGYETTANTLFWLFYEIGKHPEVEKKLKTELNSIAEITDYRDLVQQIPYTIACVREILRLYPPIWIMSRTAIDDFTLAGVAVSKQTDILLSPYLFHRMDRYWEDPSRFNPGRFMNTEISPADQPYYFPFGVGARACIGERLALMEIYLVLLNIFRGYSFTLETKIITPQAHFTLRPSDKILINLLNKENGNQTSGS